MNGDETVWRVCTINGKTTQVNSSQLRSAARQSHQQEKIAPEKMRFSAWVFGVWRNFQPKKKLCLWSCIMHLWMLFERAERRERNAIKNLCDFNGPGSWGADEWNLFFYGFMDEMHLKNLFTSLYDGHFMFTYHSWMHKKLIISIKPNLADDC